MSQTYENFKFVNVEDDDESICQRIMMKGAYEGVVFSFTKIGYNKDDDRIEVGYLIHDHNNNPDVDSEDFQAFVYEIASTIILMKETIEELNEQDRNTDIEEPFIQ